MKKKYKVYTPFTYMKHIQHSKIMTMTCTTSTLNKQQLSCLTTSLMLLTRWKLLFFCCIYKNEIFFLFYFFSFCVLLRDSARLRLMLLPFLCQSKLFLNSKMILISSFHFKFPRSLLLFSPPSLYSFIHYEILLLEFFFFETGFCIEKKRNFFFSL